MLPSISVTVPTRCASRSSSACVKSWPRTRAKQLKKTLWPFRKRPADLEPDEKERLDRLLAHSPHLKQAYDLREQLTTIFDITRSKATGIRRIKAWRRKV